MATVDVIRLQVIINAFQSVTDEMSMALIKTAFSTNIKDRRDCSCAIYTPKAEVISQTELGTPVHLGVMPSVLDRVLKEYALDDLSPGDHVLLNVPHPTGPGHINDISMVSPVYIGGRLAFLVANMAHHVDMGGFAPGSMGFGLSSIFQEGLQIPPVKIVKKGVIDRELIALIKQNVRTQAEVEGDIHAQMACNNVGARRLTELAERFGLDTLTEYAYHIFDYSERRMRAALKAVPKGVYEAEDAIEGTPRTPEFIRIRVKVTVEEDTMTFDFTGTDPQVSDSINSNLACTKASCYYIVKALLDPGLPPNIGSYRPLRIIVPEGCVINAKAPAAVGNSTIIVTAKIVDVLLGAMVQAVPEQAAAASNGVVSMLNIGGCNHRNGRLYSYVETYAGGQGAMHNQDGMDGVQCHMTNTRNAPVEVIETAYPLLVRRYGLVQDSDGPGQFRGGLGVTRALEIQSAQTTGSISLDRMKTRPWGVRGGHAGGGSACTIQHPDGRLEPFTCSKMTRPLEEGSVLTIVTPGAGGWGEPRLRDARKVLWDVTEEFISPEKARDAYGVAVRKTGFRRYEIDADETERLRSGAH